MNYKPGPFDLGRTRGAIVNVIAISWTAFEVIILVSQPDGCRSHQTFRSDCIPQILPINYPVTALNMNYSWVITVAVMLLAGLWYWLSARKYYDGPRQTVDPQYLGSTETIDEK